ncbi:MAG: SRPBCC family protein [Porticoccaceae bacterium]
MTSYNRVQTSLSGDVAVAADAYWRLLLEWDGILRWMRAENRPIPLVEVKLKSGHRHGQVPCTRLCRVDTAALPEGVAIPEVSAETLLHFDDEARMIYYCIEGEGPFGMRNYLAITEVDELGPERSRITCRGRWELPEDIPVEPVRLAVQAIYESIIQDIAATVAGRSPAFHAGQDR